MATINELVSAVNQLQTSVTDLQDSVSGVTTTIDFRKQNLLDAVNSAQTSANTANIDATTASNQAIISTNQATISTDQAVISTNAATTSTNQAVLSTTARNEAEAFKNTANAERLLAETARNASETFATQSGIARDQAVIAKDDAETASALINNQVDFTGAVEGDLLERNSLGVYVPKSPKLINKSLEPFLNSPLSGYLDLDNVFAWDSFNRPDGDIGIADSGQNWLNLGSIGGDFVITNNSAKLNSPNSNTTNYKVIDLGENVQKVNVGGWVRRVFEFVGFVISMDESFSYHIRLAANAIQLIQNFEGVETALKTVIIPNVNSPNFYIDFQIVRFGTNMSAFVTINGGITFTPTDLNSDTASFTHIRYAGIMSNRLNGLIHNVLIKK